MRHWLLAALPVSGVACALVAAVGCGSPEAAAGHGEDGGDGGPNASRDAGSPRRTDASDSGGEPDASAPFLTALSVTSAGSDAAAVALVPAFAPRVYDYYVRCAGGSNPLRVSMTASAGATSLLVAPKMSGESPAQTLSVSVLENQAVVAVARNGRRTTEYWVRCLPPDMPEMTWDDHPLIGPRSPGYYLLGNFFAGSGESAYAIVLDNHGVPVWYAKAPGALGADDVDSVTPGTISYDPFMGTLIGTGFVLRTLSPPETSTVSPDGYVPTLHELRALPNGNYMVIAYSVREGVDFTGRDMRLPDGGTKPLGVESMLDCAVLEFTPAGDVVWTWLAGDHFGIDALAELQLAFGAPQPTDGGVLVDGFHCNSIDVDMPSGNLLLSGRDMDAIFYVERATGRVLWKMGGGPANLDGAGYVEVADPFFRQHDARLQPGWTHSACSDNGQISVFDDESYVTGAVARAVVYDVVIGGAGDGGCPEAGLADAASGEAGSSDAASGEAGSSEAGAVVGKATVAWKYQGIARSGLTGSFRISADGSRVIDWGVGGVPDLVFTEVDEAGHDLLDFYFANNDASYRTIKLPRSAFDIGTLRRTAGLP